MRRLQAQVRQRRDSGVRGEDGVGELEESVAPAVEAFVERVTEADKSIGRVHDEHIMHLPIALRILYLPTWLKRKLRDCLKSQDRPKTKVLEGYETGQKGLISLRCANDICA